MSNPSEMQKFLPSIDLMNQLQHAQLQSSYHSAGKQNDETTIAEILALQLL